jgi:AraC-like DNA-binding protein
VTLKGTDTRVLNTIAALIDGRGRSSFAEIVQGRQLSDRRLQQLFAEHTGVSMMAFWMSGRMHLAATLLLRGSDSVKQAMIEAGYTDASTFSRNFRRHFGVRPSTFTYVSRRSGRIALCKEGWLCPWLKVTAGVYEADLS